MGKKLKILFATDFSQNSRIALKLLKKLEEVYQVNVALIHVVRSFWKDWFASKGYREEALQRLNTWQLELTDVAAKKKLHVDYGNAANIILQTAHSIKSNLIILGGKAATNSGRYKTGATVETVARHFKKSVWVCKNDTVSKIVCGIDGSPASAKALQFSLDLCRRFSASLSIVSALPNVSDVLGMDEKEIRKEEKRFRKEFINNLNLFLDQFDFSGIPTEKFFPSGMPSNILLDMAEDFNYDLIVVGAKGHSKLYHVLIGSTAEKILRYAPCSLLVVR